MVITIDDGSLLAWLEALLSLVFTCELLVELADDATPMLLDELDDSDELDDGDEAGGDELSLPPPPHPTIIPLAKARHKESITFD